MSQHVLEGNQRTRNNVKKGGHAKLWGQDWNWSCKAAVIPATPRSWLSSSFKKVNMTLIETGMWQWHHILGPHWCVCLFLHRWYYYKRQYCCLPFGCENAQVNLWGCCFVRPEQGSRVSGNHSHMLLLLLLALRALFSSLFSVAFI